MKIAVIDPSFFTIPYDHHLCQGLADNGLDVTLFGRPLRSGEFIPEHNYTVATPFTQKAEQRLAAGNDGRLSLAMKGIEYISDARNLVRTLKRDQFDVVHIQWAPLPMFDARLMKSLSPLPIVFTVHDTNPFHGSSSSALQMLGLNKCLASADRLLVHTEFSRETLEKSGHDPAKIAVVPHGLIAHDASGPVSDAWQAFEDKLLGFEHRLLLLGAVKPYKGTDILLRAFAALPESIKEKTAVVICGELKMPFEELKALVAELGIENNVLWWTDWLLDAEVQRASEIATIRMFPYREIDASGALLQALPLGNAIVASRVGGFANLFDGDLEEYLFDSEDWQRCTQIMAGLLEDADKRALAGQRIKHRADNIDSWTEIGSKTRALYESIQSSRA